MQKILKLVNQFLILNNLIKRKQIFLQIEIQVRFQETESDRVIEVGGLKLCDIGLAFYFDEVVHVVDEILDLLCPDDADVGFDFGFEVVEAVEKCSDIAF